MIYFSRNSNIIQLNIEVWLLVSFKGNIQRIFCYLLACWYTFTKVDVLTAFGGASAKNTHTKKFISIQLKRFQLLKKSCSMLNTDRKKIVSIQYLKRLQLHLQEKMWRLCVLKAKQFAWKADTMDESNISS